MVAIATAELDIRRSQIQFPQQPTEEGHEDFRKDAIFPCTFTEGKESPARECS